MADEWPYERVQEIEIELHTPFRGSKLKIDGKDLPFHSIKYEANAGDEFPYIELICLGHDPTREENHNKIRPRIIKGQLLVESDELLEKGHSA